MFLKQKFDEDFGKYYKTRRKKFASVFIYLTYMLFITPCALAMLSFMSGSLKVYVVVGAILWVILTIIMLFGWVFFTCLDTINGE